MVFIASICSESLLLDSEASWAMCCRLRVVGRMKGSIGAFVDRQGLTSAFLFLFST